MNKKATSVVKKMGVICAITVLALGVLAGCGKEDKPTATDSKNTPEKHIATDYVKDASITVDSTGKAIKYEDAQKLIKDGKNHIDWYFDPYCPACVNIDQLVKDDMGAILKKHDATVTYHIVNFLNPKTTKDYSNRATAYMLGVGEVRPDLFSKYMYSIMTDNFHPGQGVERTTGEFKDLFIKLGGTEDEWSQIISMSQNFISQSEELTNNFFNDEKMAQKSPMDGEPFVPFIIVNDKDKAIDLNNVLSFTTELDNQFAKKDK